MPTFLQLNIEGRQDLESDDIDDDHDNNYNDQLMMMETTKMEPVWQGLFSSLISAQDLLDTYPSNNSINFSQNTLKSYQNDIFMLQ